MFTRKKCKRSLLLIDNYEKHLSGTLSERANEIADETKDFSNYIKEKGGEISTGLINFVLCMEYHQFEETGCTAQQPQHIRRFLCRLISRYNPTAAKAR